MKSSKKVRIEVRRVKKVRSGRVMYWIVQCSEHGKIFDKTARWDKKTAIEVAKAHCNGAHPSDDLEFGLVQN